MPVSLMPSVATTLASSALSFASGALATAVAYASHDWASMPPSESTSLMPLSGSGLCEAVTMRPTACPPLARERSTASMPMR